MKSKAEVISWKAESDRLEGQEKAAADRKIICLNLCTGQVHTHTSISAVDFPFYFQRFAHLLDGLFTREKYVNKAIE